MSFRLRLFILAVVLLVPGPPPARALGTVHAPILIQGDGDLCDRDDRDGDADVPDGIVNCGTADGSAERPYLVQGWRIELPDCGTDTACQRGVQCSGWTDRWAGLAVCDVTKHVRVDSIEVWSRPRDEAVTAIALNRTSHTSLERSAVRTNSVGLDVGVTGPVGVAVKGATLSPVEDGEPPLDVSWPLVRVWNANVTIDSSHLDATGFSVAMEVDAQADEAAGVHRLFAFNGSQVANAGLWGVRVRGASASLRDSEFLDNGQPGTAPYTNVPLEGAGTNDVGTTQSGAASLAAAGRDHEVVGNLFRGPGPGLLIETGAADRVDQNHFELGSGSPDAARYTTAVVIRHCGARLWHNNFNLSRVVAGGCEMDARFNWWGQADPTTGVPQQAIGEPRTIPPLTMPIDELPTVVVLSPPAGGEVFGRVVVRGRASSPRADNPIQTVHWGLADGAYEPNAAAEGREEWAFALNTDAEPFGPFSLWVRAAGTNERNGIPLRLDLVRVPVPRPPVAIIEAQPRAARPGQTILLDARDSYSPQGTPIVEYLINAGDGRSSDWSHEPTRLVEYAKPGLWYATLSVRDVKNVTNTNVAQVLIRVDEGAGQDGGPSLLPGPGLLLVAAAMAVGATLGGRRR